MTDAEIKERIQELEDEREDLGELDEDSRDELRELRDELRSRKAQAKADSEARRKWQAASTVLRVTIPGQRLREGVTWESHYANGASEDDFVLTGEDDTFFVLTQADFQSMAAANGWPEKHGFTINTLDRQSVASPIETDIDSSSGVFVYYTANATQEDGAAVADLDALPVVCPSCAAARAVSLGRRGARHYFSCKECGEEFWLQEFDDRTQEAGAE